VKPFTVVTSKMVPLLQDNIDTDQIIPARFLKVTGREGLGGHLFEDLRLTADGSPRDDFPLNRPEARGASVLIAGANFGCGSSREHAPWALADFGFRSVMSTSFGDIFFANALKNGLLPVVLSPEAHGALVKAAAAGEEVTIHLPRRQVQWPGGQFTFSLDRFAALCLEEGLDQLGYILRFEEQIAAYEARHPEVGAS
jgi:3-isopropylmalate/(R)-2-methylmalate dehydratase small subunit